MLRKQLYLINGSGRRSYLRSTLIALVKFILALSGKKYIYTDGGGGVLDTNQLYKNLFTQTSDDHSLYLQLGWELADFISLEDAFSHNDVLKKMCCVANDEVCNFLKNKGLKNDEKLHLKNTLLKIRVVSEGLGGEAAELILAKYLICSFSCAIIKPFWFEGGLGKEGSFYYNYSILDEFLKSVKRLQVYLENYEDNCKHPIF